MTLFAFKILGVLYLGVLYLGVLESLIIKIHATLPEDSRLFYEALNQFILEGLDINTSDPV